MIAALTNHLWQSTVFATVVALLTVAFRKNRAQVRYWLWLSASLKFLVPFSLLISLGGYLAWAPPVKQTATQAVSDAMVEITQPFPDTLTFTPSAPRATDWLLMVIPLAIFGVWLCGFAVIAVMRFAGWLRVRAVVRAASPLKEGEILRSAQNDSQKPAFRNLRIVSAPGLLEPGVVGFLRPTLLLPEGILKSLTPPQLEAVLAHELSHVQRRDNLTAAMHMIVETVFWFHPLVWWIGTRLVEERELACDEEVLRLGSEPRVYAESILNVCKFYAESPSPCVSGVTGSDIKKRVERIMRNHVGETLNQSRKLILATAGMAALALPLIAGALIAPRLRAQAPAGQSPGVPQWQTDAGGKMAFDVASVKKNKSGPPYNGGDAMRSNVPLDPQNSYFPNGGLLSSTNTPASFYIAFAYKLDDIALGYAMVGLPPWADRNGDRFDIEARAQGNPTKDQMRLMMQSLLADRFKLALHKETRQMPFYALVLATSGKLGPQLQQHSDDPPCANPGDSAAGPPQAGSRACAATSLLIPARTVAYILRREA